VRLIAACALLGLLAACAPQTGIVLEVQGPNGESSVDAGITSLRLVVAHPSYCERWISDQQASTLTVKVAGRDLERNPITILLSPDRQTSGIVNYNNEQPDPLRAIVLASAADGHLVGVAAFDPHPFVYEEVRRYSARIALLDRNDAAYLASDGCVCVPGVPLIGNSSGSGCDQELPPSFARLVDTAGCELPKGAMLPLGVCDGQLYPGEVKNRDLPCFGSTQGACRVGHRICNDQGGRAYDRECVPDSGGPALPSGALCDAYLGCEKTACADPGACLQASTTGHKQLRCVLPVNPTAINGASAPCDAGDWSYTFDGLSGAACVGTMLDGMSQGPAIIGWEKDASTPDPVLVSSLCPPSLVVGRLNAKPDQLPQQLKFTLSLGDSLYDVTLTFELVCSGTSATPQRRMRCN
jgi:hypothetical protein